MSQFELCNDDLKDGEMREVLFTHDDGLEYPVLLVKKDGEVTALGAKCTHYAAPLAKGVFCKGIIRCPWHGACFNAKTGDIEDFPGLDSLPVYPVMKDKGKIFAEIPEMAAMTTKRQKKMCKRTLNPQTILIVGGGPAALSCAETLRQEGYDGRIVMAIKEKHLPYDRIKLSKALSSDVEVLKLRNRGFYIQNDIEVCLSAEIEKINFANRCAFTRNHNVLEYSKLLIATGSSPRQIPVKGGERASNVCYLRTPEDANLIDAKAVDQHVVIVGSGFIGMEVASYLVSKALSVVVVTMDSVPFELALGTQVGQSLKKWHESKGIRFYCKTSVRQVRTEPVNGDVYEVVLNNARILPACLLVIGVGVVPNTSFLASSHRIQLEYRRQPKLDLNAGSYIRVNAFLETSIPDVYAAGDVAEFPLPLVDGARVCIGHWQMALKMGQVAAKNMLASEAKAKGVHQNEAPEGGQEETGSGGDTEMIDEKRTAFKSVPFFWSVQYGKSLRFAGFNQGFKDVIIHGRLETDLENPDPQFLAYYVKEGVVVAAASLGMDPIVAQFAEALRNGCNVEADSVRDNPTGFLEALAQV